MRLPCSPGSPARVFSVERIAELAQAARRNLDAEGVLNAEVVTGDGTLGLPERAPFDGIVVAAAFLRVPAPLAAQLAPGGKLVMPVGNGGGDLVKVFEARDERASSSSGCCAEPVSCPCSGRTGSGSTKTVPVQPRGAHALSPARVLPVSSGYAAGLSGHGPHRATSLARHAMRAKTSRPWFVGLVESTTTLHVASCRPAPRRR